MDAVSGADYQTFLTLLTSQLKNQDPLNPQDSTEFVAQLAQFSAVEQQVQTNTTLGSILGALGGEGAAALTPWLGAEVEAPTALRFDGEPLTLRADPSPDATSAVLVAQDETGATVARIAVDPTATELTWDGSNGLGGTVEPGNYRFSLVRMSGDETLNAETLRGFAAVSEARMGETGVELVLESGDTIPVEDVAAVRSAAG